MKRVLIMALLTLFVVGLFSQTALSEPIAIRQGANIEWIRASATIAEGVVHCWSDTRNGGRDLFAQLIAPDGSKVWEADGLPVDTKPDRQEDPMVVATSDGNVIVAWIDYMLSDSEDYGNIYAQKITPAGVLLWDEGGAVVCGTAQVEQGSINMVPDNAGGAYIAWNEKRTAGAMAIFMQHIQSNGTVSWEANGRHIHLGQVVSSNTFWEDTIGGAVIAYTKTTAPDEGIYYSRWDQDGLVWGPHKIAEMDTVTSVQQNPKMCPDGVGGFIFAWEYKDARNSNTVRLKAQRINISGSRLWGNEGVNVTGSYAVTHNQSSHRIVEVDGGGAIIAWEDRRNPSHQHSDIYVQKLTLDGTEAWTSGGKPLYLTEDLKQIALRMTKTNDGGAVIVWEDTRNNSVKEEMQIFAQKINSNGTFAWAPQGECLSNTQGGQTGANVKQIGNNFAIVWLDSRTGSEWLRTQIVTSTGTHLLAPDDTILLSGLSGNAVQVGNTRTLPLFVRSFNNKSYIFWLDSRHGAVNGHRVYYQIVDENGVCLFEENGRTVSSILPDDDKNEDYLIVEMNPAGETCVVWAKTISNASQSYYVQLIAPDGSKRLGDFGVELRADGDTAPESAHISWRNNGWEIYWSENAADGIGSRTIFGQRIEGTNLIWGSTGKRVAADYSLFMGSNNVTLNAVCGDYLIYHNSGNSAPKRIVKLDANGDVAPGWGTMGDFFELGTLGKQFVHGWAPDFNRVNVFQTSEHIVALWTENYEDHEDDDSCIYVAVVDLNGNNAYFENITQNDDGEYTEMVAYQVGNNEFVLTYLYSLLGITKTYGQRIVVTSSGVTKLWGETGAPLSPADIGNLRKHTSPSSIAVGGYNLAVWGMDKTPNPPTTDVLEEDLFMAAQSLTDGTAATDQAILLNDHIKKQQNPRLARHNNNKVTIVWQDAISSGKDPIFGIYMQIVDMGNVVPINDETTASTKPLSHITNYPNPFNPSTTISFNVGTNHLPVLTPVQIDIYNIKGQKVKSLVNDSFTPGTHKVVWNGTNDAGNDVGSGVYFYRVKTNNETATKKMVLMK